MTAAAMTPPQSPIEHLRIERRSFVIGTLVVWMVALVGVGYLFTSMEPALWAASHQAQTFQQAMSAINQAQPLTNRQQLLIDAVMLVGGVALFFLNWRFSFLIHRPRRAFAPLDRGGSAAMRWLWWSLLALNSLFYVSTLISQLVVTAILSRWGSQEIARLKAAPPAGVES